MRRPWHPVGGSDGTGKRRWRVRYVASYNVWAAYVIDGDRFRDSGDYVFSTWREAFDYAYRNGKR